MFSPKSGLALLPAVPNLLPLPRTRWSGSSSLQGMQHISSERLQHQATGYSAPFMSI